MVSVCSFIYLVCELYGNLIWPVTFSKCQVLEFIAVKSNIYGNLEKKVCYAIKNKCSKVGYTQQCHFGLAKSEQFLKEPFYFLM